MKALSLRMKWTYLLRVSGEGSEPYDCMMCSPLRNFHRGRYYGRIFATLQYLPEEQLIGQDTPEALLSLEVRSGNGAPFATRTRLGWAINGPLSCHTMMVECLVNVRADEVNGSTRCLEFSCWDMSVNIHLACGHIMS
ncbi:hypothetical protein E2C01_039521 [Portunus trituberculatus]|uniref:Uncharacterized protein n=1 Tax=Portunus trituberculatus TaxID=210409 RepID=A0A5B7FJY0_PORTR|nr:hypothetical protein [Portunus trituberculatus]